MAWVDDEPALFISYCLTHPPRGWDMVGESRTADCRQGSKVPDRLVGRSCLCYSCHKLLRLPGGCFSLLLFCCASVCLLFPSVLSLTPFMCSGIVLFSSFCIACHIPYGGARHIFLFLVLISFDLLFVFLSFSLCH